MWNAATTIPWPCGSLTVRQKPRNQKARLTHTGPDLSPFAQWMRDALLYSPLAPKEIEDQGGPTAAMISKLRNDKSSPSRDMIHLVAKYTRADVDSGLRAAGLLPEIEITYERDPDELRLVHLYRGLSGDQRNLSIELMAQLAAADRAGAIGGRVRAQELEEETKKETENDKTSE